MPDTAAGALAPYRVLINAHSGGALKKGEAGFDAMRQATALNIVSYDFHHGAGFMDRLRILMRGAGAVLVGGGDGTIAQAAAIALQENKPFGILPMGTMNMLARDLGIPSVLETANIFDLYANSRVETIDVGFANDRAFLCCAALGAIPDASRYREKLRYLPDMLMIPRMAVFVMQRLHAVHRRHLRVTIDGATTRLRTSSLVVSNNLYAASAQASHKLAKETLHGNTLGVYSAAPQSWLDRLRLLIHVQQGALEADQALTQAQAGEVTVTTRRRREWISLDGEAIKLPTPLRFTIRHDALKLIMPGRADA